MNDTEQQWYSIGDVADITGVNPVTLRAWQRRYGLIKPHRTEKGHRLFNAEDIETIKTILSWLDKGVAIRNVKPLLSGENTPISTSPSLPETEQLLDALANLNFDKADQTLSTCLKEYPLATFKKRLFHVIESTLRQPERPHKGLQYTLWRTLITQQLSALTNLQRQHNKKPCWLIRCGQRGHTLAWLTAMELSNKGYRVNMLDGIQEKLSPFTHLIKASSRTKIVIVGEEKIKPAIINELQKLPKPPELLGSIAEIHANDFE